MMPRPYDLAALHSAIGRTDRHVGFDWRRLRGQLRARGLREIGLTFSPLDPLGPLFNSQAMMRLQP